MSRRQETMPASYFEDLYRGQDDPWRFRTSDYERSKYEDTLAVLGRSHYPTALEVGCSIGVFTRMLAGRCGNLVAVDASAVALATARQTLKDLPQVELAQRAVPDEMPNGPFDLIVLSEVLYYLTAADVRKTAQQCRVRLRASGELCLCHWLGETDYPLTGDQAADAFLERTSALRWSHRMVRRAEYRLDLIRAADD